MNVAGKRTLAVLDTCHPDMVKIFMLSLQRSAVDFGAHEGGRLITTQQEYFDSVPRRTSINPKTYESEEALAKKAKHIVIEGHPEFGLSRAVDLHASEKFNGKSLAWDGNHLSYIAGVFYSVAKELYDAGEVSHLIRWGGDWDSDGIIGLDHKLKDFPHFELVKP